MFDRELVLLKSYIDDLDKRPTFGKESELRDISYSKFVATELINRFLDEEASLPTYIPDRMPYSSKEIIDDYITELTMLYESADESDSKQLMLKLSDFVNNIKCVILDGCEDNLLYTCQDVFTGRYFKSNIQKIQQGLEKTNDILLNHGCVALNTYYSNIGISGIKIGYNFSWEYSDCPEIKLDLISGESDDGRHKCLYVDFETYPKKNNEPWGI